MYLFMIEMLPSRAFLCQEKSSASPLSMVVGVCGTVGAGAISFQCRSDDERVLNYLKPLSHDDTFQAIKWMVFLDTKPTAGAFWKGLAIFQKPNEGVQI